MREDKTMTITEFLLARIDDDEAVARDAMREWVSSEWAPASVYDDGARDVSVALDPRRVLAECAAKRRIIELHRDWPVLVDTPPRPLQVETDPMGEVTLRMAHQIAWLTEQEYRHRFGTEPPTGPVMRALAAVYADHPDYQEEWKP